MIDDPNRPDLLSRVGAGRPTDADLDMLWPPAERDAVLAAVLAAGIHRRRATGRAAAGVAVAAVAAVALVPSVLGSGDAAAAELHALAVSATHAGTPVAGPGQWQHIVTTSRQVNADGSVYVDTQDSWTGYDGHTYLIDHSSATGRADRTEYDVLDRAGPPSYGDPTPAFAASLPDDADGLIAYLDPRVSGSSSHAEAMYSALIDLAGSRTLPPRTLAAAFDALATIDDVTTEDQEVDGRAAVQVSYAEESTRSSQTYVFDRDSGQCLSVEEEGDQSDYRSTSPLSKVVDRVPAGVLARFEAHRVG